MKKKSSKKKILIIIIILIIVGIVLGVIGFTGTAINYPIYKSKLEKGKKKYAYEIVQLAREISEERKR